LNAANEVAVHAFLQERIGFLDIPRVVGMTLDRIPVRPLATLADVYEVDRQAREAASQSAELASAAAD
jgi:1-deoxy-D-xylulose-5-phosphate reductoisomerase